MYVTYRPHAHKTSLSLWALSVERKSGFMAGGQKENCLRVVLSSNRHSSSTILPPKQTARGRLYHTQDAPARPVCRRVRRCFAAVSFSHIRRSDKPQSQISVEPKQTHSKLEVSSAPFEGLYAASLIVGHRSGTFKGQGPYYLAAIMTCRCDFFVHAIRKDQAFRRRSIRPGTVIGSAHLLRLNARSRRTQSRR